MLVVIYFLKSIFVLSYHFFSINFLMGLQKDLSNLLYRHYLKDYLNFILLRSSTIFRLVIVDTGLFISGLRAILDLFVGTLTIIILIIFLFKVNFLITFYSILIFFYYHLFISSLLRRKLLIIQILELWRRKIELNN